MYGLDIHFGIKSNKSICPGKHMTKKQVMFGSRRKWIEEEEINENWQTIDVKTIVWTAAQRQEMSGTCVDAEQSSLLADDVDEPRYHGERITIRSQWAATHRWVHIIAHKTRGIALCTVPPQSEALGFFSWTLLNSRSTHCVESHSNRGMYFTMLMDTTNV